jgi:hypothetical protein
VYTLELGTLQLDLKLLGHSLIQGKRGKHPSVVSKTMMPLMPLLSMLLCLPLPLTTSLSFMLASMLLAMALFV